MLIVTLFLAHTAISLTAARWWLRPLLLSFDRRCKLPPCKESDFYFFCATWSIVVGLVALYGLWIVFLCKLLQPLYRSVLPKPIQRVHEGEQPKGPLRQN